MSIVVELKVIKTTANSTCKFNLLIGIAAHGLADYKRLATCYSQIDYANQAVEPARQQRDAVLGRIDRITPRRW